MAFSLGGGLSAMGYSIEKSAATMLLEQQKAELDDKRVQLADSLAGARESKGRAEEHANRTAEMGTQFQNQGLLNTQQNTAASDLANQESKNRITENVSALKAGTAAAVDKVKALAAPDVLKATAAITAASASPNLSLQVDSDTGQALLLDANTGKTKPITGADGNPVTFQNKEEMQLITSQLSALSQQRQQLMEARRQDVDAAKVLHKDDQDFDINTVTNHYDTAISDLNSQYQAIARSLQTKRVGNAPPLVPSNRPPLSSFLNAGAPSASDMVNSGGGVPAAR